MVNPPGGIDYARMAVGAAMARQQPDKETGPRAPGPPPEPSRFRSCLAVAGVLLLLCCVGGGGYWAWSNYRSHTEESGLAQDAARSYADNLVSGSHRLAYRQLCEPVRSRISEEEFIRELSERAAIDSYEIVSTAVRSGPDERSALVDTRLTVDTGEVVRHTFRLVVEDGRWRVCEV